MVKINPEDYQPEQRNTYDFSLTREEKIRLFLYLLCIVIGIALLGGLFKSVDIVNHHQASIAALQNISNTTSVHLPDELMK